MEAEMTPQERLLKDLRKHHDQALATLADAERDYQEVLVDYIPAEERMHRSTRAMDHAQREVDITAQVLEQHSTPTPPPPPPPPPGMTVRGGTPLR